MTRTGHVLQWLQVRWESRGSSPRHLSREEEGGCPVQGDTHSDLGAFSQFHALSKEPTARDYKKALLPWVITWVSAKSSLF